jgi:hypothetical protein
MPGPLCFDRVELRTLGAAPRGYRHPMMTNADTAPDPVAAALAIVQKAHTGTANADHPAGGTAAIVALTSGVIFSLIAMAAMITSPATIPMWCAAHGGCP